MGTRLTRLQLLTRDEPLRISAVLDESVLRRNVGDHWIMCAQPGRLADTPLQPEVTVRILPVAGDPGLGAESHTVRRSGEDRETTLPDVVHIEELRREFYVNGENDTYQYQTTFDHLAADSLFPSESRELIVHRQAVPQTDDNGRGGAMRWQDRVVTELATICRAALGSWNRTGQLCAMICCIALGLALLIWAFRR